MITLKNKAEFDFVYKNGRRHCGKFFNLYAISLHHHSLQNKTFSYKEKKIFNHFLQLPKDLVFGLSVSKKIGNSPQRNLIKRRFRSFCRVYAHLFPQMIVIFMAKEGVQEMPYVEFEKEILEFLPKARGSRNVTNI